MRKTSAKFRAQVRAWAIQALNLRDYRRGWLKGDCPSCGAGDKFGINPESLSANCFKCGVHNLYELVARVEQVEIHEVSNILNSTDAPTFLPKPKKQQKKSKRELELPESFIPLLLGDNEIGRRVRKKMKSRGFDLMDLAIMGVGYCTSGEYMGSVVFPFYYQGQLVYYTARRVIKLGVNKFINPNSEVYGIGKASLIYNVAALSQYSEVNLLESITNALTLGPDSVAILGKKASQAQLNTLLRSPVEIFNIILDPDAKPEAISLALALIRVKKVRVLLLDGDKDVNDLGYDYVTERLAKEDLATTPYLLKLKQWYEAYPVSSHNADSSRIRITSYPQGGG